MRYHDKWKLVLDKHIINKGIDSDLSHVILEESGQKQICSVSVETLVFI